MAERKRYPAGERHLTKYYCPNVSVRYICVSSMLSIISFLCREIGLVIESCHVRIVWWRKLNRLDSKWVILSLRIIIQVAGALHCTFRTPFRGKYTFHISKNQEISYNTRFGCSWFYLTFYPFKNNILNPLSVTLTQNKWNVNMDPRSHNEQKITTKTTTFKNISRRIREMT